MKFNIYYCVDDDYSSTFERCNVEHRLLEFRGNKLEVELCLSPEVIGHSNRKFNVMFKDKDDELDEDERKYFTKANFLEVFRLKWMFGKYWIQGQDGKAQVTLLAIGFLLGLVTSHLSPNDNSNERATQQGYLETDDPCYYFYEGKKYFEAHFHEDYFDEGSRETAIELLSKAAKQGCEDYDLYYLLYTCHVWTGGNEAAIESLSKAIEIDPAKYQNFIRRGQVKMKLGDLDGALEDFLIYSSYPDAEELSSAYYMCGAIYYSQGDSLNSTKYRTKAEFLDGKLRDYEGYCRAHGLIK